MLAVMVGTWASLWVKHGSGGCCLAISPCIFRRALTLIIVYAVDASSTVLERVEYFSLGCSTFFKERSVRENFLPDTYD